MHQIRSFISNRHEFYQNYINGTDPKFYHYRGMQNAFTLGSAVDYAIKEHYAGGDLYSSLEFSKLDRINQATCLAMVENYIYEYQDELYKPYQIVFKVPVGKYLLIGSPDLMATHHEGGEVVIEIKTGVVGEALDFQTMFYCWASWRWNFKVPVAVIKRTLSKPRIKLKAKEKEFDFKKRLALYNKHEIKVEVRDVNKSMVVEFEKYLLQILSEINFNKPYTFYKQAGDYWGD